MLRIAADPRVPGSMKKAKKVASDPEMRAEYDFASMKGGVRGKYAERYQVGVKVVLLGPEVATALASAGAAVQSGGQGKRVRRRVLSKSGGL